MGESFRSAFTQADLIGSAAVATLAGQYNKLGEYKVQAGEMVGLGYGAQNGQENATGRLYSLLKIAAGTEVAGTIRLSIYSPQDRPILVVDEFRTETINQNATDRTKQVPFPFKNIWVTEDKKIVMEFKPDADATLDKTKCVVLMDITKAVV